MASLRPPSTSPSPSPGPGDSGKHNSVNSRQSMGPSARGSPGLVPGSPRPGGGSARPTSELLGGAGMFQTPEAEALDQWFENLQNYEATLEEMAAASLDVNFKEELSAIEQWFKVLSEAERTAALYSLLQHSTQVQIRFFITVLQQMARSDPMTALLSPAMGGSMQNQMDQKLSNLNLKSPSLKSNLPASPTTRNFSANRQSLTLEAAAAANNFLSPDSAATQDAANTLAQQRAKLKASNAAHRISAPVLASGGVDGRGTWGPGSPLGQVVEQNAPVQEITVNPASRPKSTEFSGSPRAGTAGPDSSNLSPAVGDSWASMVNTPLIPMFKNDNRMGPQTLDNAASKLNDWSGGAAAPGVPRMGDPKIHRRVSKGVGGTSNDGRDNPGNSVYGDDGNIIPQNQQQQQQQQPQVRGPPGGLRNASGGAWNGRSPALNNNVPANRFGGADDAGGNNNTNNAVPGGMNMNGLGMGMAPGVGGFNMAMGSPGLGMSLGGMGPMTPFNMNMLSAMGISPEAQLLAAQMAASGFGQPGWMGMQPQGSAGLGPMMGGRGRPPNSARSIGSAKSGMSRAPDSAGLKEEDVDPALLNDIPAWLRSLRLHKYTPNFDGMKWEDMVMMDEAALEAKGVAALGARRKMMKTFETVRKKMGIEGGPPPVSAGLVSP